MFKPVDPQVKFPELEEKIIAFWKGHKTFEKSVTSKPKEKRWTFLDGPPFVTGMPHYGHLLGSIHKDIFGRYWTMKGYQVRRVWGWDGHGLPIENKVENKLEIKRKKDIEEKVGVKKFIEECKKYVNDVSGEWEWYVDHIGRWVDFKDAYKTWDMPYMESVMWVFKQMYEKGYIYKGLRVTLYCPHCATPISNFEVAMDADNYKEIPDAATTYKFEIKAENSKLKVQSEDGKTYILAWSTTPWNKIVTPALAVNPNLTYVKVNQGDENYILAKSTLKMLRTDLPYQILEEFKGSKLIGMRYVPHYDYYPIEKGKKSFEIIPGDFVTADEGTGVVTIAAYGEEDLKASLENNIHIEMHLDEEGIVKPDVPLFGGMYYLKANKAVNEDLAKRNLIYKDEELLHNVPLCWRCHTRLYYAPITAWYVNVQTLKPLMKKTNEKVNWFPKHFKYGRFLKSLENAPDWNISRNRYWGSPVPVWECTCGENFVPGSIKELEEAAGKKISDLHKPEIDEIVINCTKCGKKVKRVPEVLDSWIEAGSASFAERHFPFNQKEKLEDFFPPDFIAEYTGQIRAWFYVLHVIGGALYQSRAFKNVGVEGVILGTDGRKMSKNLGNYPDPKELLAKYGADALRLYLMGSPIMHGEDIIISEEHYRNQVRGFLLILWNVYNFFVSYAIIDKFQISSIRQAQDKNFNPPATYRSGTWPAGGSISNVDCQMSNNVLDKWILSLLYLTIKEITESLESYDTVKAVEKAQGFVNDLSTWYIRRSRDRVGPGAENEEDKQVFYQTTYEVLTTFTKAIAPLTPFIAEEIYKNLTGEESVHLTDWPIIEGNLIDTALLHDMQQVRIIVEKAHAARKSQGIKLRQPLKALWLCGFKSEEQRRWRAYETIIKEELNVKEINYTFYKELANDPAKLEFAEGKFLDLAITPDLKAEGEARDIIRLVQAERKKLGTSLDDKVDVTLPQWPQSFEGEIKRKALIRNLAKHNEFSVKRV